jgi:large subunit ribosomal protein L6
MSRIGNKPVHIPDSVKITIDGKKLTMVGPKGTLFVDMPGGITAAVDEKLLKVARTSDTNQFKALHGLARSLANNAIIGVSAGYVKDLELVGTGYRVAVAGANLVFSLGLSHQITFKPVQGVTLAVEGQTKIKITGIDKQLVGQVAANIRALRPPEPYKGKGIRYVDEVVRRKPGKAAVKSAA